MQTVVLTETTISTKCNENVVKFGQLEDNQPFSSIERVLHFLQGIVLSIWLKQPICFSF